MNVLVATNFLVGLLLTNDANHTKADAALPALRFERRIVAAPVLIELFHLIDKYSGYAAAVRALRETHEFYEIELLPLMI